MIDFLLLMCFFAIGLLAGMLYERLNHDPAR